MSPLTGLIGSELRLEQMSERARLREPLFVLGDEWRYLPNAKPRYHDRRLRVNRKSVPSK